MLTLVEKLSVPEEKQASAAAKKKKKRRLWGNGSGRLPHQGQAQRGDRRRHGVAGRGQMHVDAHARGPGKVRVRDFVKKKNVP